MPRQLVAGSVGQGGAEDDTVRTRADTCVPRWCVWLAPVERFLPSTVRPAQSIRPERRRFPCLLSSTGLPHALGLGWHVGGLITSDAVEFGWQLGLVLIDVQYLL